MDSISRHEQLLRIFQLVDLLFGARRPLTIAEIKQSLRDRGVIDEMSEKNIRRDVDFLVKFGYAVKRSKQKTPRGTTCQAWSIEPGRGKGELSSPAVSLPELLSLVVAREFLAPLAGTFYWRGIGQLLAKLESVATPQGLADDAPKRIVIEPEALVVYDSSVYVAGYRVPGRQASAAGDGGIRFFKLDRIVDTKPSARRFTRRGVPVEALLADSITLFRSADPPRRYRLRIDAARARWAREKPFHPRQRVADAGDGRIIVEVERAWDDEMLPQLLALGEHVEVLEPEDMRDRLLESARRIAAKYMCHHLRSFEESYVE